MSATYSISIPQWLDRICVWPLLLYRRLTFGQPYRKIYLGEGAYTIVDPDVYYEKCQYKWYLTGNGQKAYPAREKRIGSQETKRSYLHREIVKPRKGMLVDHRDSDPLNNLRSNLRQATHSQNLINRPKRPNTSSKYRGVSWDKCLCKWEAVISWQHKGRSKKKHLAYFDKDKEIDAARAYDIAAIKYHRRFARLNFPREDYVRTRNGYKYAGQSRPDKKNCPLRAKLCKIYSSIISRFGKYMKMKGRVEL
ncbi:MAG: HNH endonuclease [Sedimentisphaerales bacterium]